MVLRNASTNSGSIVSPSTNSSEVSSQSTRPSFRAMKPSRLADMWIVTRDSVFVIVSPSTDGIDAAARSQATVNLIGLSDGRTSFNAWIECLAYDRHGNTQLHHALSERELDCPRFLTADQP